MSHVANRGKIDFKKLKKNGAGHGIAEPEKFAIGLKAVIKYNSNDYTGARPPQKALICKDLICTHARVAPQPPSKLEPMLVTAPRDCREHLRRIRRSQATLTRKSKFRKKSMRRAKNLRGSCEKHSTPRGWRR